MAELEVDDSSCMVEVQFEAALDHRRDTHQDFKNRNIVLISTFVFGDVEQGTITTVDHFRTQLQQAKKVTVFLCGGPGDKNEAGRNKDFNDEYLKDKGCLIFLNYRGTGSGSEMRNKAKSKRHFHDTRPLVVTDDVQQRYINLVNSERSQRSLAGTTLSEPEARDMANLLTLFRQDSIVYDLESIRQCLFGKDKPIHGSHRGIPQRKWHIFGQSYGGWISLTYLSLYPDSLESSTITAGLAPITAECDDTYCKLFEVVKSRNDRYYGQYPGDIKKVKDIVRALLEYSEGITVEDGRLTARRFLCIGRNLGAREKFPKLNELITKLHKAAISKFDQNLEQVQEALKMYKEEDSWKFDRRPLYAVLHEAMYCRKNASDWSARRVASELTEFKWAGSDETGRRTLLKHICKEDDDKHKIYFSGEMVYPFMFEDYDALKPLKDVAEKLAQHEWTDPYDIATLQKNKVSVTAVSYKSDMHVHPDLSEATAALIAGIRHEALKKVPGTEDEFQHASLRTDTAAVFKALNTLGNDSK